MSLAYRLVVLLLYRVLWVFTLASVVAAWRPARAEDVPSFPEATQKLLASASRPTVAEIIRELGDPAGWPEKNPFGEPQAQEWELIAQRAPRMIAELMFAYPDATLAPMGRDVSFVGDLIDAYFIGQGEPGRVKRLNASGESYGSLPQDWEKVVGGFLETNGLNLDPGANPQPKPFILLDYTGFNSYSQSTRLINAAYRVFESRGGRPEDLLSRFHLVNLSRGGREINPGLSPRAFFTEHAKTLEGKYPRHVLSFSVESVEFTRCRTLYCEWHGPFTRLTVQDDGRVTTRPGDASNEYSRMRILTDLFEIVRRTRTAPFVEAVQARLKELKDAQPCGDVFSALLLPDPGQGRRVARILAAA